MISKTRFTLTTVTFLTVMAFSAMWTMPALADDSTPPPTETPTEEVTEEAPPVVEEILPTEVPVVEQAVPEEIAPVGETVAELLTQVPEGTELVVVNREGETVPLVTQEAADAIAFVDPIWCPTGVAPQNGTGGCTVSYASLYLLINDIATGVITAPGANGVIWIQAGADASASPIVIDGSDPDLNTWGDFSLTLNGGWDGTFGSTAIIGTSTFNNAISIVNWNGAVTVNDITMLGASNTANSGTGALYVQTSKNIMLSNITAINTVGVLTNGAYLDNRSSTIQSTVTVKNSSFNNNGAGGLTIYSNGIVTLTNVNANFNAQYGVYTDNSSDLVASPVTVTNSSFNNNNYRGLWIISNGAVKLSQVTAGNNGDTGVYVDNRAASSALSVTVAGSLTAFDNGASGLEIYSKGVVNLAYLITNDNLGYGTYINNSYGSGLTAVQAVNVTGTNAFNDNGDSGLYIASRGAITLSNVTAIRNGFAADASGVYLINTYDTAKPQNITLNGSNFFLYNSYDGLGAFSYGTITINNVTATDNGNGVNDSDGSGIYLYNRNALSTTPRNITVTGVNSFTYNDLAGLYVSSMGVITVSNVTASHNGVNGVTGGGAYLDNSGGSLKAVVLKGTNLFSSNDGNGLYIASKGAIMLNNVTAVWNGFACNCSGVFIYNDTDTAKPQDILLTGYNFFLHNAYNGLTANSYGAITINNVTAEDNGNNVVDNDGSGVYLYNAGALSTTPKNITVNGINSFTNNDFAGLYASSIGVITISNVTASNNGSGGGAYLTNFSGSYPKAVVLKGNNTFTQNAGNGLTIYSKGAITLNNVTAHLNLDNGAYLYNAYGTTQSAIFVNGYGLFEWNTNNGLYAQSNGAITTRNLSANYNDGNGVYLFTKGILAPQAVILNGNNTFNFNGNASTESGLVVNSDGTIRVNNVNASYNFYKGANLDNYTNWDAPTVNFLTFGSVIVTGYGNFTGNASDGLNIYTHGAVSLTNVTSNFNGDHGIEIDADGNVTLVCSSANNNAYGFWMYGTPVKLLTLKGLITAGNTISNEFLNFPVTLVRTRCP